MKELTIEFTNTMDDAITGSIELTNSVLPWFRCLPWIGRILLLMFLTSLVLPAMKMGTMTTRAIVGNIFMVIITAYLSLPLRWRHKLHARRSPCTSNLMRWHFTESELNYSTKGTETRLTWEVLTRVLEREMGFLIFTHPRAASWVPKHAFQNEADMETFREMAKSKNLYKV